MGWKIWQKKSTGEERTNAKLEKLSRPKDIPELVGRYLIVHLKKYLLLNLNHPELLLSHQKTQTPLHVAKKDM